MSNTPREETVKARPYIGGQAVLEGVMMRSPRSFAVVVRRQDGSLHVHERSAPDEKRPAARLPLIRGVASLVESLRLGSAALKFSADQMEMDLTLAEAATAATKVLSALTLALLSAGSEPGTQALPRAEKKSSGGMGGLMLLIVLIVFIALPQATAALMNRGLGLGLAVQSPLFQALTGLFKLTIVIGYLSLIRRVPDIRRVFQYHGAEHKTISTYEAREALTVENARAKTTLHPRCGTTFIVMVALVSILVFTLVGGILPKIETGNAFLNNVVFFLEKLPFLPVMVAVTFEIQRVFARYCTVGPLRALLWPGFLVQKITTIEPDDSQLEVALASLRATLFREENGEGAAAVEDARFPDYASLLAASSLSGTTSP